ncbi:MAG: phosphate regulon transcriptional regulator PhoB [Pseudomonadota bacterium]
MTATSPARVLVVEDEPAQLEALTFNLETAGFQVTATDDGEDALILFNEDPPDAVVLDWMLPNLSGIETCRQLKARAETRHVPILMLTARGEEADMIRGLDTGADDFMVKPYSVKELIARLRALLRRARPAVAGEILVYGDLSIDPEQHKVMRSEAPLHLGPTEYRLLTTFMERPGRVWTRDQLLDRVWGRDADVDTRTVDVHIGRLRKSLMTGGHTDPIRTVRGVGYSLDLARDAVA